MSETLLGLTDEPDLSELTMAVVTAVIAVA